MSNDVVISKTLMERVIDSLEESQLDQSFEIIRQLRSLPETVSLEGVKGLERLTLDYLMRPDCDGEYVRFSDLLRLIAPVQPSAVVSREGVERIVKDAWNAGWASAKRNKGTSNLYWIRVAQELDLPRPVAPVQPSAVAVLKDEDGAYLRFSEWLAWCGYPEYNTKKTWAVLAEEYADRIISTQLPQPVAPVQSGGVEELSNALADAHTELDWHKQEITNLKEQIAHLTTTQSAPSVGSVPSVGVIKALHMVAQRSQLSLDNPWFFLDEETADAVREALRIAPSGKGADHE